MKNTFLIVFLLLGFSVNGQRSLPYNCELLKNIIKAIDIQKQYVELSNQIGNRVYVAVNPTSDKDHRIIKKDSTKKDAVLDSILALPIIDTILDAETDSVFFLSGTNVLLDTFNFFSPACSCELNHKNIIVVNSYKDLPKDNDYNLIIVSSLDSYRGYSGVSIRHRSSKSKLDCVAFYYLIERNIPVVKKIMVSHKEDYYMNPKDW